jgi:hypothetical protein
MEDNVRLPLLHHIASIPQGGEPRNQWFGWLTLREGLSLQHIPSDKGNENQQQDEVKLVDLVMCFVKILIQLADEVAHPVHLHPFNALSYEVDGTP